MTELEDMILDPKNVRYACDPLTNGSFLRAKATTRDFDGKRLVDYVSSNGDVARNADHCREVIRALFAGQEIDLDPVLMVPIDRDGKAPRWIGIASYPTRCIANALVQVLARATKPRLPRGVRAYVPGVRDPNVEMVKDIGFAVAEGFVRYYLVLDWTNFFPSMPRAKCREALIYYGVPAPIADGVMRLVNAKQYKRGQRGNLVEVATNRGSAQGLPQSSLLANLLPYDLDEHFEDIGSRLFHARYADDTFSGSRVYDEVVGAGRTIRRWATSHGIEIKNLSVNEAIR